VVQSFWKFELVVNEIRLLILLEMLLKIFLHLLRVFEKMDGPGLFASSLLELVWEESVVTEGFILILFLILEKEEDLHLCFLR
jgi:hypothetical protein